MPEVTPFAAIRYDHTRSGGDLADLIAPPYDVLDQDDKNVLLARSDRNVVAIDLPHVPPKTAGPAEVYQRAADTLDAWLADGTLVREEKPALYLYHQTFEHGGRSFTRRKFFARVRLQPFSHGSILPHERTFGGPKEDRLALMKATKCQLSPIFGLYTDPEDRIGAAFTQTAGGPPDVTGTLGGVENRLWIVTDRAVTDLVVETLTDRKVYIADGHHRYSTALLYRDWLMAEMGGSLPEDHPANYVMFVLASMDDPGCLILPYNRVLANVDIETVRGAFAPGSGDGPQGASDLTLFDGATGREIPLRFTNRAELKTLEPDQCPAWHDLDYAYLHRYLIDELLAKAAGTAPQVRYVKSAEDARRTAREEHGVALLTNATPMAHLRSVSDQGGLMPQKSTYFHPKLATGLAINPLDA